MYYPVNKEVAKESFNTKLLRVSYYDLSATDIILGLCYMLNSDYDVYFDFSKSGIIGVMVHNRTLCLYYDDEQDGFCNLANLWAEVVVDYKF